MSRAYFEILIPVLSLLMNMLCQVLSYKCLSKTTLTDSIFAGLGFGFLSLISLESYYFSVVSKPMPEHAGIFITHLITYVSLGYCYFHFINLGETARRIRILIELSNAQEGLSIDEILIRYNAREIVQRRLGRLTESGQIVYKDNRYYIGKNGMLFISKLLSFVKVILIGKSF